MSVARRYVSAWTLRVAGLAVRAHHTAGGAAAVQIFHELTVNRAVEAGVLAHPQKHMSEQHCNDGLSALNKAVRS